MKRKKKWRGLAFRNARNGYLFILPFLLGFVLFMFNPLLNSLRMSFSNISFNEQGFVMDFVGTANYQKAFLIDPEFNRFLTEELLKIAANVPFIIILSFFVALLLNQKFKFRGLARSIFFLPVILSSGVIVGLEYNNSLLNSVKDVILEDANTTRLTEALKELLLGSYSNTGAVRFVLKAVDGIYDVTMACGIQILVFLSGLQSISSSMYEAAKIEGATAWESFWKITLPMISSLILVNIVYSISDTCIRSDSDMLEKLRTTMVQQMDFGLSSAMSWAYFAAIMAVVLIVVGVLSKVVFYDE